MAAKIVDSRVIALEALSKALTDPAPRVLIGSGSAAYFTGKGKEGPANLCTEQGWVEPTGEVAGKGAKAKKKYRITAAGIQAVLQERQSEPLQLLRSLGGIIENQVVTLKATQEQIAQMLKSVGPLANSVEALERRLQPPDLEGLRRQLGDSPTTPPAPREPPQASWLDDAVHLATEQRQRDRFQPLALPALYHQLRQKKPDLTLGQFHDGLRELREQRRIRLVPFTRALATIDDPRNALFLDGEVMFYVDLP